jgi:hypothetical protein
LFDVQEHNYPAEIFSPYLSYSLFQAAIVQQRLHNHTGKILHKHHVGVLKDVLEDLGRRWMVAGDLSARQIPSCANTLVAQYVKALQDIEDHPPSLAIPSQGIFISTGKTTT